MAALHKEDGIASLSGTDDVLTSFEPEPNAYGGNRGTLLC
jgi:hypothetical protein